MEASYRPLSYSHPYLLPAAPLRAGKDPHHPLYLLVAYLRYIEGYPHETQTEKDMVVVVRLAVV